MIKRLPLAIAGSLSVLLSACPAANPAGGTATGDTVKIGFIAPLTGGDAAVGEGTLNGTRLAIDAINQAGGVNGKKLELIYKDDQGSADRGVEVAKDLVQRGVVAVIGPTWSGVSKAVVQSVTAAAGLPVVSPGATSPELATFGDNGTFFRTIPNDTLQAKALSNQLIADGHTKVTILCRNNPYGNGFGDALKTFFETKAGNSAVKYSYPDDDKQDYPTIKAQILPGSTAIAMIGYTGDGANIFKDWIASGESADLKWYFSESLKDAALARNVNNNARLEGMKGTFPFPNGTFLNTFTTAYKARFGKEPAIYDANAYDATMLIALAMVQGKANTREAVKANLITVSRDGVKQDGIGREGFSDAVAKINGGVDIDYDGVSGAVDMDDRGELKGGNYVIWKWQNGLPVDTETVFKF